MKVDEVYRMFNDIQQKCFELEKRVAELEQWRIKVDTQLKDHDYIINVIDNKTSRM